MADLLDAIQQRRSIRSFEDKMVPEELIQKVIDAGIAAPTGKNAQSPIILAITNKEVRDELSRLNYAIISGGGGGIDRGPDPFYGAPVILVVLANADIFTAVEDGSLVLGNMLLEADSLGLGAIWIHRARQEFESEQGKALLKKLGIEGNYIGIGHCALGYIKGEKPAARPKKDNWVYWVK